MWNVLGIKCKEEVGKGHEVPFVMAVSSNLHQVPKHSRMSPSHQLQKANGILFVSQSGLTINSNSCDVSVEQLTCFYGQFSVCCGFVWLLSFLVHFGGFVLVLVCFAFVVWVF